MTGNMRFIVPWSPRDPTKVVVCFYHQSPTALLLLPDYRVKIENAIMFVIKLSYTVTVVRHSSD